jgi:hypothetical protein
MGDPEMTWAIESTRDAPVAPTHIYQLYADPSTWSEWGHNAKSVRMAGPMVEGGTVHVRAGYGRTYACLIRRLVDGRALELEVRPPLITVIQTYEVAPTATGARVRHVLAISGPLSRPMRWVGVDRLYQGWLDKEVGRLIEMASRPREQPRVLPA